jgi:hypothetical protein
VSCALETASTNSAGLSDTWSNLPAVKPRRDDSTAGFWMQCVGALILVVFADILMFGKESAAALAVGFLILVLPSALLLAVLMACAAPRRGLPAARS